MKTRLIFWALALSAVVRGASPGAPLTVHEWGTFTTVSGSDGVLLPGLEREEEALPAFVRGHVNLGAGGGGKGWGTPVTNVTVKMETPVLYFYSAAPRAVRVDVGFRGGSISQWYPEKTSGERLMSSSEMVTRTAELLQLPLLPTIDFARGYQGSASWKIDVLARDAADKISAPKELETRQWPRARVAGANKIRGPKGEVEGFIFYRGIGNFPLPFTAKVEGGRMVLSNSGADSMPFLLVYEKRAAFPHGVVWWSGSLAAGADEAVSLLKGSDDTSAATVLAEKFPRALERAGLTAEEAKAMLATWRESYFERDGLRVFWIVPRAFTDQVLPLSITPAPQKLERVLVGRSEVLTPEFEQELIRELSADRQTNPRWIMDRYYLAYRARVRQLGVVSPVRSDKPTP